MGEAIKSIGSTLTSKSTVAFVGVLVLYLAGVGLAVFGALGIAAAITISPLLSWAAFVVGMALVVGVHEYLDGPL